MYLQHLPGPGSLVLPHLRTYIHVVLLTRLQDTDDKSDKLCFRCFWAVPAWPQCDNLDSGFCKYAQIRRQICIFHNITWCTLHYKVKYADFPAYLRVCCNFCMFIAPASLQRASQLIHKMHNEGHL
jgi:hypothetical protein